MKKILVPTDFSAIADYGLEVAIQIAKVTQAEIYLVNTIEPIHDSSFSAMGGGSGSISEESRYIIELHRIQEEKIDRTISNYYTGEVKIHSYIIVDEMQDGIRKYIDEHQIGLVVMGTSGESTYTEYFMGNHTEQVIRISHCPVLSVRKPHPNFKINKIILATDLNKEAYEGITHIKKFADYFDAPIHILHVLTSNHMTKEKINTELETLALEHHFKDYTLNIRENSNQREGILRFAKEIKADLIAVITHGRTGLANLIFGSVSEDLVKTAKMPVLTAHIHGDQFDLE